MCACFKQRCPAGVGLSLAARIAYLISSYSSLAFVSDSRDVPKLKRHKAIFLTPPSTKTSPTTFGQLVSPALGSAMTTSCPNASCPCCSFLRSDLFLPKGIECEPSIVSDRISVEDGTGLTDVVSPADAWHTISNEKNEHGVLLVDTHGHPHLERDIQYAETSDTSSDVNATTTSSLIEGVVSLTCAVSPLDWDNALSYASQSSWRLPALGIHPWYLGDIMIESDEIEENVEKYARWDWLNELEHHLSIHPNLIVGEIGLCKMARFVREFPKGRGGKATAVQLQKLVFRKQIDLAAKYQRPTTVHCVNMHGSLVEVLKEILNEAKESYKRKCEALHENDTLQHTVRSSFPPSIAMHSFTGTAHHVRELLLFEQEVVNPNQGNQSGRKSRNKKIANGSAVEEPSNNGGILFYFGFSHAVNHVMCTSEKARRKGMEAVLAVPSDRLLAESDVHATADVGLGTAGAVAYIAAAKGEGLSVIAEQTAINGLRYLNCLSLGSQLSK